MTKQKRWHLRNEIYSRCQRRPQKSSEVSLFLSNYSGTINSGPYCYDTAWSIFDALVFDLAVRRWFPSLKIVRQQFLDNHSFRVAISETPKLTRFLTIKTFISGFVTKKITRTGIQLWTPKIRSTTDRAASYQ